MTKSLVKVREKLQNWGIEGYNNHEDQAFKIGYIKKYFPNYLFLKKDLLERRDKEKISDRKRFFNALRIYVYSIYENTWYGYLLSHYQHKLHFSINTIPIVFGNPYRNHLPSFSAAILHFGTCRDHFFVLLKMCLNPEMVKNKSGIEKLIRINYRKNDFEKDLAKLSGNNQNFISQGQDIYGGNEFRNFFAHRMRLLWWKNTKCSQTDYFVKKEIFYAVRNKDKHKYMEHVFDVFENHKSYEQEIATANCADLLSSGEILRDTHKLFGNFFNESLEFVRKYIKDLWT